jgi:hypothetical protein
MSWRRTSSVDIPLSTAARSTATGPAWGRGRPRRRASSSTSTNETRNVQQTDIDRVQNVNTSQSVLERMLQVGTVDFDTAGTGDSDFKFAGVEDPEEVVQAVDRAQKQSPAAAATP